MILMAAANRISRTPRRRLALSAIMLLLSAACASDSAVEVSSEEANSSLCVHVMGGLLASTTEPASNQSLLADALEVDRRLLAASGDDSTAAKVEQAVVQLRGGGDPVQLTAYLGEGLSTAEREEIAEVLAEDAGVERYEFVSSEQAFEEFIELYGDQPEFYADLPRDALPASFRISMGEGADVDGLADQLGSLDGVDEVKREGELANIIQALQPLSDLCDFRLPFTGP